MAFRQSLVDLRDDIDQWVRNDPEGKSAPTLPIYYDFTVTSDSGVRITSVKSSCQCVHVDRYQEDYQPGEVGVIRAVLNPTAEQPGRHEYAITVEYTDPEPRRALLKLRFVINNYRVMVQPPIFAMFHSGETLPDPKDVLVVDPRPQPLEITRIAVTSPLLNAKYIGSEVNASGATQHRIRVTAVAAFPTKAHAAAVRIHTNDPDYKTLTVSVQMQQFNADRLANEEPPLKR
jgi:hypothetical protein